MTVKPTFPEILFEDDSIIVLNKPAGLLSIPDREQTSLSLKDMLLAKYGSIFTVHRLDKDTSGIILFARTEAAHKYYSRLFEERKIEKYYLGLVLGSPAHPKGTMDEPISEHPVQKGLMVVHRKGKPAVTDYEVVEAFKTYSLVQFQLHTGRTHQIRVHCKNMGHPLACDELYGDAKPILLSSIKRKYKLSKWEETEQPILGRLALHAYRLRFTDEKGTLHDLSAEMPKDMRALLQQLRKV
jgi:23S rRNA pseudouridine955/2504/2580 synthase/23S rRNA pseudouridine1911/1915/1917 synthase